MMSASPNDNLLENSIYVGINLQDILYGVELVLYFKTMHVLLNHPGKRTRADVFYAIFSTVMLLMSTIWVTTHALFGQEMWVLETDITGDADNPWTSNTYGRHLDIAAITHTTLQLMTDALMVYRCRMIWNSCRVIVIPSILWMTTLALGAVVCWRFVVYGGLYSQDNISSFTLPYYGVSVFLTAMLTCMICYHLLRYGRLMREHLGREYASMYFAIVALVIESVLPYTLSGVAFLISLGLSSQTETVFGYVYVLMMCISPQMLILRVAMRASTHDTNLQQPPSTVMFSPLEGATSGTVSKGSEEPFSQALGSCRKNNDHIV